MSELCLNSIKELGTAVAKSGLSDMQKVETGIVYAWHSQQTGIPILDVLRDYPLMYGKPYTPAAEVLARFRAAGGHCKWLSGMDDRTQARAFLKHKENEGEFVYTVQDAEREGLTGKPIWKKNPAELLRARLATKALKMIAPELIGKLHLEESDSDEPAQDPGPLLPPLKAPEQKVANPEAKTEPPPAEEQKAAEPAKEPKAADKPASPPADFPPAKFLEIVKGREVDVLAWAKAKGKLDGGETLAHLKRDIVNATIENPDRMWRAVDGFKKVAA